jgi:galactose mutarotase-like enzyme
MEKIPYLGQELTRWDAGNSTFLAIPELGARLMHWHVTHGDGTVRDVIHWPELENLDNFAGVRGGNPVLFPFSGRSFDQGEIFFWRGPDGERRPMPIHGIARQSKFDVIRCDERGFSAQLIPNDITRASYPFEYEFIVTYRFEALKLFCEFSLRNLDTRPLPWSAGHHFYFTLPWNDGLRRGDYAIRIPASKSMRQNFHTGRFVDSPAPKPQESLANPALVDTFHTGLKSNAVVFGPVGHPGEVIVRLGTENKPPKDAVFVTWTPDDTAPFYCVEPWMGPANANEHRQGLHWVQPGLSQSFVVEVEIK